MQNHMEKEEGSASLFLKLMGRAGQHSKGQGTAHEHLALMPEQLNTGLGRGKNKLNGAYSSKIRSLPETLKKHPLIVEK